ncbi:uncharacterized protein LOC134706052 [Mytilus trossulus]|uniref:uncharacterized protein LOC134706052 n=1 Tax=Mytilus trossulus TaxID=6551 RepID=UPI0030054941
MAYAPLRSQGPKQSRLHAFSLVIDKIKPVRATLLCKTLSNSNTRILRYWKMWIFLGIIQFSFALLVNAGSKGAGGGHAEHNVLCLTSHCAHDEVCRLHNTNGQLNGQCISKHNEPYKQADRDGCPQLLGVGYECFCNNYYCVQQTQAATGQHAITSNNQNDLVCGDHVCHGHQYCIVEEEKFDKLHLKCADVHNTQHCLPNLLSLGSSCFCDTRTCVDHTLISIFAGHQVAGLICQDHDSHACHANQTDTNTISAG